MEKYIKITDKMLQNNSLCMNAKILYSKINILSKKDGYCFASNKYLSNLMNVSTRTITRLIKELKACGYINIIYDESKNRRLYMVD